MVAVHRMNRLKKALWFTLGIVLIGIAYVGLITPGIPWSTPTVGAAYCFAKSSEKMHNWIMNHKIFGPFLRGWAEKRVFPVKARWLMIITMDSSLIIMWYTTQNWKAVLGTAGLMLICAIWALRYPKSSEDHDTRVADGKRVGWFK
jgi:uncharacterized membrane protein YbaN (DUF454 family)